MSAVRKLAGQTAIYGLPSIIGRFLNFLLVPIHTAQLVPAEYGVITDVYALVAFVMVVLTFGLETAFFRYASDEREDAKSILGNALGFLTYSSAGFLALILFFQQPLADVVGYSDHSEYILWMGLVLAFDAWAALPMAQLRKQERPVRFATINVVSILINILGNLFFIGYCMPIAASGEPNALVEALYSPEIGLGYIFLVNVAASASKVLLTLPIFRSITWRLDPAVIRKLLAYGLPLMVAGFAGIINETLDRRLIRVLLEPKIGETAALAQVGIYGACYKLAFLVSLFTQAFRYAAEPYFFARARELDAKLGYAEVMKWFSIAVSVIFAMVLLLLDAFKYFISNEAYWEGLHVVPILMAANLFMGWNYNLSVWYKLTNRTIYGTLLAITGAVVTIGANLVMIPRMGYTGAAWATLAAYSTMFVVSSLLGQRFYRVPYDYLRMFGYPVVGITLYGILQVISPDPGWVKIAWGTALFGVFLAAVWYFEGKHIKRVLR